MTKVTMPRSGVVRAVSTRYLANGYAALQQEPAVFGPTGEKDQPAVVIAMER